MLLNPRSAGFLLVVLATAFDAGAEAPKLRPVDDSYTVSQRYFAYQAQYPQLQWPTLQFKAGRRVLFDRFYKKV